MFLQPIIIEHLSFEFPHKVCFENFSTHIHYGDRIGIIGKNGSGKSSLLRMLTGEMAPSSGRILNMPAESTGYVPQVPLELLAVSGGEHFNQMLSRTFARKPDILILDEPTNHLDMRNRNNLVNRLNSFRGTLIIASHDSRLLDQCVDSIWHLDEGAIRIFHGCYADYQNEVESLRTSRLNTLNDLRREKGRIENARQKSLIRNQKSHQKKSSDKNKMSFGNVVNRAQGKNERTGHQLGEKIDSINGEIKMSRLPDAIVPQFYIEGGRSETGFILSISSGWCGYDAGHPVLSDISLSLSGGDKIALLGDNGSGKTTLFKALLRRPGIISGGDWLMPPLRETGHLDQHYATLPPDLTVEQIISTARPDFSHQEIRKILNRFLFRKNAEISARVSTLSGGEKARLSLAQISVNPPRLLLLDEITNNVDMETREHLVQVLSGYPGAMIVISHDHDFLDHLPLTGIFEIEKKRLEYRRT